MLIAEHQSAGSAAAAGQATGAVLMIRPTVFYSNPETAASNEFQRAGDGGVVRRARVEFEGLVNTLRTHGVEVLVVDDTPDPETPDAVFPNNWLSTHADGTLVTYPMLAPSRRAERRDDIVNTRLAEFGFVPGRHLDLTEFEARGQYLEGTGSLVLDRIHRVAYACLAARTHPEVVAVFARELGYDVELFHAFGPSGRAIYHTNVMMCIGTDVAVVCLESIHARERDAVSARLAQHRTVVPITLAQMQCFAGNMLELRGRDGEPLLLMSSRARHALTPEQATILGRHRRLVHAPVNAIEDASGGSVRCMLAEIFLPRREPLH